MHLACTIMHKDSVLICVVHTPTNAPFINVVKSF